MKKLFFMFFIALMQTLTASTFVSQADMEEDYDLCDFQAGDYLELTCHLENELFDATLAKLKCSFKGDICVAVGDSDEDSFLFSYDKSEWFTLWEIIEQDVQGLSISKCSGFPLL